MGDLELTTYLNSIGRIPLLSADQEVTLARAIQRRRQLLDQRCDRTLEEWAISLGLTCDQLDKTLAKGERARDKLVEANLRFVVSKARNMSSNDPRFSLDNLISLGNRGLIEAAERFDPTKGYRFTSYASWWIFKYQVRAQYEQLIRRTSGQADLEKRIKKAAEQLNRQGDAVSWDAIASLINERHPSAKATAAKVERAAQSVPRPVALETAADLEGQDPWDTVDPEWGDDFGQDTISTWRIGDAVPRDFAAGRRNAGHGTGQKRSGSSVQGRKRKRSVQSGAVAATGRKQPVRLSDPKRPKSGSLGIACGSRHRNVDSKASGANRAKRDPAK